MKYKVFGILLLFVSLALPQAEMSNYDEQRGPRFNLNTFSAMKPDNREVSIFNLYVEVRNDELQFVKMSDGYEASYEVSAVILDKDDDQVDGKIWKEEVFAGQYDETNARNQYSLSAEKFELEPGEYKVFVAVLDLETDIESKRRFKIKIADYSKNKLAISDIAFVRDLVDESSEADEITPVVSTTQRGLQGKAYAYFEIYNPKEHDVAQIETQLSGENTRKKEKNKYDIALTGFRTTQFIPINADSLEHDTYTIKVKIKAGGEQAENENTFFIRWEGLPSNSQDLETAIEQVKYIATREEWKRLDKAGPNEKMNEFKAFWKRHDPTPGTEANEAMEAHYGRIEYANQNFSAMQRQGWKTDMGMVFIILGAPDDIERNAYPRYSKPYEIWRYYRYNRDLLFYDYTGFGEYRLATPFSIYEFQRYLQQR